MEIRVEETWLRLLRGDIIEQDTEAIVNAANPGLLGAVGVSLRYSKGRNFSPQGREESVGDELVEEDG